MVTTTKAPKTKAATDKAAPKTTDTAKTVAAKAPEIGRAHV